MRKQIMTGVLLTALLAVTVAVAAPEDRFKGASHDGYDSQAAGSLISMNDAWGRMVGGTYDGYAAGTANDVLVAVRPLGSVLIVR